jgi:hypothetical protein
MTGQPQSNTAEHLRALEERLFQPATRKSPQAVTALLADDFREFGASGRIYTRPEIIAALADEPPCRISLTNFECRFLPPGTALVTYRSTRIQPAGTTKIAIHSLRSSLWVLRERNWQMLFHQGTRI